MGQICPIYPLDSKRTVCYYTYMAKRSVSFRMSDEGAALMAALAKVMGISQTAVVELLLRDAATARGVKVDVPATATKPGKPKPAAK